MAALIVKWERLGCKRSIIEMLFPTSNSVATVVIARWEGAYDAELAERVLNGLKEQEPAMIETSR